jgi:hypothetical protein
VSWYDGITRVFKGRRKDVHFEGESPPSEAMDPRLAELRTRPSQDEAAGGAGVAIVGGYIWETERNAALIGPKKYALYNDNVRNCDAQAVGVRAVLMLMGGTKWDVDPPVSKSAVGKPDQPGMQPSGPKLPGQEEFGEGKATPTNGKPPRAAGTPSNGTPKIPAAKLLDGRGPSSASADSEISDDEVPDEEMMPEGPSPEDIEAQQKAEWMEDILFKGMVTSWSQLIRQLGMYKFHGFTIHEWIAKRRDDGTIGLHDVQNRAQTTIEKWDMDRSGVLQGVFQRIPLDGTEEYIPRWKMVYVVDSELADGDPQGVGLFRHSANKVGQLKRLEQLEGVGYETDLRGIPVVYAPIAEMDAAIASGKDGWSEAKKEAALLPTTQFMEGHSRNKSLAIRLDSTPYRDVGPNGSPSQTPKWKVDLLTGGGTSHESVSKAIDRKNREIARTLFAEGFLLGGEGGSNRALGEEKNRFLAAFVNSLLTDVCDALNRDVVRPLCLLNGIPEEMWPTLRYEAVSVTDVAHVAEMLKKVKDAGAPLDPRDPVINTLRARANLPYVPDELVAAQAQAAQDMRDAEVEATRTGAAATMAGIGQKDKEIELGAQNAEADREMAAATAAEDRKLALQTKKPQPGKAKPAPRK